MKNSEKMPNLVKFHSIYGALLDFIWCQKVNVFIWSIKGKKDNNLGVANSSLSEVYLDQKYSVFPLSGKLTIGCHPFDVLYYRTILFGLLSPHSGHNNKEKCYCMKQTFLLCTLFPYTLKQKFYKRPHIPCTSLLEQPWH